MQSTLMKSADGKMPYFPALDGVRAYCVLLVMYNHVRNTANVATLIEGHLGVDLFFIISGFLITTLLRRERHFSGRIDLRAFYWRRFFRIIPVYSAVLLLYVGVCQLPSQATKWTQLKAGLPYFMTFMNEYVKEPNHGNVFTHTWSLGVEEKFYLVWPMLFFLGAKSPRTRMAIVAALLLGTGSLTVLRPGDLAQSYFGLMMGALMAVVLSGRYAPRIFLFLSKVPAFVAVVIFMCGFLAATATPKLMIVFSAASAFFLSFLLARETWISKFHELPLMVWFGKRSYSMYLVHILCLNVIETRVAVDSFWKLLAVLFGSYILSALVANFLYRTVEEPTRQAGRAFLARNKEVPAAV